MRPDHIDFFSLDIIGICGIYFYQDNIFCPILPGVIMARKKGSRKTFKSAIINSGVMVVRDKNIKEKILILAGQFKKPTEISVILKEEHPEFYEKAKDTLRVLIGNVVRRNRNYVNALKEEYIKQIMEVPGAHKRVRLDRLETLYDEDGKTSERRETLKAMREEMEGARVNLNLYQLNILGGLSDEELARREREIVERIRVDSGGETKASEDKGVPLLPTPLEAEVISSV